MYTNNCLYTSIYIAGQGLSAVQPVEETNNDGYGGGLGTLTGQVSKVSPQPFTPCGGDMTGSTDEYTVWIPVHFKTSFKDEKLRNRMAVITCLPSGIKEMSQMTAKVTEDGNILEIRVAVPHAVSEPSKFLRFCSVPGKSQSTQASEFRVRAFHEALSICRGSIGDTRFLALWTSSAWRIFTWSRWLP